jgi:hypothetical protein
MIDGITDATHLQCRDEGGAALSSWPNGSIICLSIACGQMIIQGISNSGPIWIGTDSTVTNTGGGSAFGQITTGGSYTLGNARYNLLRTSDPWMAGTSGNAVSAVAMVT